MLHLHNPAEELVSVASSHYRDQLFREAERIYKTKVGRGLAIDRNTMRIEKGREQGEYYLETIARTGGKHFPLAYYVDPKRSLQRNAWAIGQIVNKKVRKADKFAF